MKRKRVREDSRREQGPSDRRWVGASAATAVLGLVLALMSGQTISAAVLHIRHVEARSAVPSRVDIQGMAWPRSILTLRGGAPDEYDSKTAEKFDRVLWDMLSQHPDEIYFLNTVFNFLQRRTPCFNGPNAERNYQILIDTLSKQKQGYLNHIAKGKAMKQPEPMPPKPAPAAAHPQPASSSSSTPAAAAAAKTCTPATPATPATEGREEDAEGLHANGQRTESLEVEGYREAGGEQATSEVQVAGLGTLRAFHGIPESQGEGKAKTFESQLERSPQTEMVHQKSRPGGSSGGKELLQVPVNNGGSTDQYVWSQTLSEVTIEAFLPKNTPTKSIHVDMTVTHLTVKITTGGSTSTLLQGEFEEGIKPDEGTWTREGDVLVITVAKQGDMSWWTCALQGHAKIDVQKIEPQNSQLHDLDADMRVTVEKMMYDQKQKAMGKPTLEEGKKKDQLKKFMEMHPEMDFSKCKFG